MGVISVANRAGADDGPSDQVAGGGCVGDKIVEAEGHLATMGIAGPLAV